MSTFLDSNILCRLSKEDDPLHEIAKQAVQQAINRDEGERPVINAQVEREFLSVATRTIQENGLGMEPKEAVQMLESFRIFCEFRDDPPLLHQRTKELVGTLGVSGKRVHDLAIGVSAGAHCGKLLTFNLEHFKRFEENGIVRVLSPQELAKELQSAKGQPREQIKQATHEQKRDQAPAHHQEQDRGQEPSY